jgi:hypothetical protein
MNGLIRSKTIRRIGDRRMWFAIRRQIDLQLNRVSPSAAFQSQCDTHFPAWSAGRRYLETN